MGLSLFFERMGIAIVSAVDGGIIGGAPGGPLGTALGRVLVALAALALCGLIVNSYSITIHAITQEYSMSSYTTHKATFNLPDIDIEDSSMNIFNNKDGGASLVVFRKKYLF